MTTRHLGALCAYSRQLLEACSPSNREAFAGFLEHLQAKGRTLKTLRFATFILYQMDRRAGGRNLLDLRGGEWTSILVGLRAEYATTTVFTMSGYTRAFLNWHHDGEAPKDVRRALKLERPKAPVVQVITETERDALLRAAAGATNLRARAFAQAVIWFLWDSGARVGELLSMTQGGVRFDDKGGAFVDLDGKTGPRTVYVIESVPALKVWATYHPGPDGPDAPFWPGRPTTTAMGLAGITRLLKRLCKAGGVRDLHPHLFRHTRATRAAKGDRARGIAPWSEPEMCQYFGWELGSKMPHYYTHLAHADMEERVRADAGADDLAAAIRADPLQKLAEFGAILGAKLLDEAEKRRALDVTQAQTAEEARGLTPRIA